MSADETTLRLEAERKTALEALRLVVTPEALEYARWHEHTSRERAEKESERRDAAERLYGSVGSDSDASVYHLDTQAYERASAELKEAEEQHARWWPQIERFERLLLRVAPEDWHDACARGVKPGIYTVTLVRLKGKQQVTPLDDVVARMIALTVAAHAGIPVAVAQETLKRVDHVGPQVIVDGVSLDDAIAVKTDLERWRAEAKIKEGVQAKVAGRRAIPERVRREVWRRDGGCCVDCGSREKLEFDHIIPVAKGGSNTTRNIELRCESCNRRKAASI